MKNLSVHQNLCPRLTTLLVLSLLSFCACEPNRYEVGAGSSDAAVDVGSDALTVDVGSDALNVVEKGADASATEAGETSLSFCPVSPIAPSQPPAACNCTRRPGGKRSFNCPAGVGESVSVQVGPEGGEVLLNGQQGKASRLGASLVIPPTALDKMVTITITETADTLPTDFVDLSPMYRFDPPDLTFALPVKVTIPIGNGEGTYPSQIGMYWSTGAQSQFARVEDSSYNAGVLLGSTMKLGTAFGAIPACAVPPSCRP